MINKKESLQELNWKSGLATAATAAATLIGSPKVSSAAESPGHVQQVKYPYTIEDIIAATIVDEAGGEKDYERGMQAVLNVILKRSKGDIRGAAKECLRPKQFSGWNAVKITDINSVKSFIDSKKKHTRYSLALKLIESAKNGTLKDITGGADHFLNIQLTKKQSSTNSLPKWFDKRKVTVSIGNHTFLKLS